MILHRRLFGRTGTGAPPGDPCRRRRSGLMGTALGNIANAADHYAAIGRRIAVELVANGPGYAMLRDTSPVRDRIAAMHKALPFVVFSACQHSRQGFASAEHKTLSEIVELPEATDVPEGIVRLITLQEQGWSYVRV